MMRSGNGCFLSAVMVMLATAGAGGRALGEDLRIPPDDPKVEQRVLEGLEKPITVKFEGTPLREALEKIAAATGQHMYVNWPILEAGGIDAQKPVNMNLDKMTGTKALALLLGTVEHNPEPLLMFDVMGDVVFVSTRKDMRRLSVTRIYDIKDLMLPAVVAMLAPGSVSKPGSPTTAPSDSAWPVSPQPVFVSEWISEFGTALFYNGGSRPDDWAERGGELASMREFQGQLLVKAPPFIQRDVQRLFDLMRRTKVTALAAELRHKMVLEILGRAESLRLEMKYDQALKLTREAEFVDPDHLLVKAMKQVLEETIRRQKAGN